MTSIYANGGFTQESWERLDKDTELPAHPFAEGVKLLVPQARFLAGPDAFMALAGDIAVLVSPGDDVEALAPFAARLPRIAVEFPKFSDGRGFSSARILREQMGYEGDIRAIGDFILDQIPLMLRCGVSSFEITKPHVEAALKAGIWPEVTHYLQPVGTVTEIPAGTRPWARRPNSQRKLTTGAVVE